MTTFLLSRDNVYRFKEQIQKQRNSTFLQGFQIEIKLQKEIVIKVPYGNGEDCRSTEVFNVHVPSNPMYVLPAKKMLSLRGSKGT